MGYDDRVDALLGLLRVDVATTFQTEDAAFAGFCCDGLLCLTPGVMFADIWTSGSEAALTVPLGDVVPRRVVGGWDFVLVRETLRTRCPAARWWL